MERDYTPEACFTYMARVQRKSPDLEHSSQLSGEINATPKKEEEGSPGHVELIEI